MKLFLLILGIALSLLAVQAQPQSPDENYIRIYQMIQEADRLNDAGQGKPAAAKYLEAQAALLRFRGIYPGWNDRVVNYRLNYLTTKLQPLTDQITPAATNSTPTTPPITQPTPAVAVTPPPTTPSPTTPTVPPAVPVTTIPVEVENQLKALQGEVERLQSDNKLLGAKLREALSVQPAAVDPKELAKAEEKIRSLLKENDLVKAQLASMKGASAAPTVPPDITTKLNEQTEAIAALRAENEVLKKQSADQQEKLASTQKAAEQAVAEATKQEQARLAEKEAALSKLTSEFETLKKQGEESRTQLQKAVDQAAAEVAAAKQAAEKARTEAAGLAEKEANLQKLAQDNTALQKQVELWKQVAQSSERKAATVTPPPAPAPPPAPVAVASASTDAEKELQALRARVKTLEASPVPYTAEELALFQKPAPKLVANLNAPSPIFVPPAEGPITKPSQGIPVGAGDLVRAAERAFARGNYEEAEKKYQDVLRQDESNVTTLGNLASAQLELGHVADAEKNALKALSSAPSDYFAQYILGRIRFRQDRIDEAFEALSRSAQANPDYADTQNYLGIVLSEKGQRGPAEAALRRAIQLQPENAVAHNNLAVVYATQKPPALALARWHYQKAISGGHPKNAQLEKMLEEK